MRPDDHAHFSGRLLTLLFLGWRNIWRNPVRSILTILALSGSLVVVILYSAMMEGMSRQMVQYATELSSGHIQLQRQAFIDDYDLYATMPWSYLDRIEKRFSGLHAAPRLYAAGLCSSSDSSAGVIIRAVDPQRENRVTKMLEHVRQGTADLGNAGTMADGLPRYNVVIGALLARNMNLKVGDELVLVTQAADGSIGNALYRVSGVLKPMEPNFDRMGVLMSVEAYRQLMYLEDGFHELAIRLDDPDTVGVVQDELKDFVAELDKEEPLDELGGDVIVRNWKELTPAIAGMLEMSATVVLFIGGIVVSLASLGMLNTMLMAVHERTQEFGILLAIGMKRRWQLIMVLFESLFLSLVSAATGSVIGVLLSGHFEKHGIDFSDYMPDGYDWAGIVFEPVMKGYLEPIHVLTGSLLMITVAMLASLIPAWRVLRLKPAEVMR